MNTQFNCENCVLFTKKGKKMFDECPKHYKDLKEFSDKYKLNCPYVFKTECSSVW